MKEYFIFAGIVAVAVVVGIVGARYIPGQQASQMLAGDFPGGIAPTNLWTANPATGAVTPIGSFSLGIGGTALANQLTALYTATAAYPATAITLGPITAANSATSTAIGFTASGFTVGDACEVAYNGVTSTSAFGEDSEVTAVSGNAATATVTFWNGNSASTTLNVTSSATGASSTLKATCFHPGV